MLINPLVIRPAISSPDNFLDVVDIRMNRPFRIVYMGTPFFAVAPLKALCKTEDVALVVTQPDRPSGRGRKSTMSPVKNEALVRGIPVLQPESVRDRKAILALGDTDCDVIVVAAYGQILPKEILELPAFGCINIHASLLPKYRGASPIIQAIIQGEKRTGVTTMMIDEGRDTGDILLQESLEISEEETAGMLTERLSRLGARTMVETLGALREKRLTPVPQDESQASYFPRLTKEQGEIDWNRDAAVIRDHVRGMDPWPGAYTFLQGERLKVWRVRPHPEPGSPGKVLSVSDRLIVGAKSGSVVIDELQLPGKKRVSGPDFLRGQKKIREGMTLGRE